MMQVEKKTPAIMGQVNKANVLHLIKDSGPMSRADVAKMLNMSRSTISTIVEVLLREGRVREGRTGESTSVGGRRPVLLNYVSKARFALGIDIGASKTIAMVTDLDGNVVHHDKFPSHVKGISPMVHVQAESERVLRESGVPLQAVIGTAIGFPGITAAEDGIVIDAPGVQLHNFRAAEFFHKLPGPIWIDNDVNMGVIGERWKGAAVGHDNVILVAIGTGIGAGFILGGRIFRGAQGFAGEIGHLHIDPTHQGQKLSLSDYGPLEQVASGKGIEDLAQWSLADHPNSMLSGGELAADRIFAAAAAGDELAGNVIAQAVSFLSFSIANMVTMLNPDVVILGGGVSRVGAPLLERIRAGVSRLSPLTCEVIPAGLGEYAAAFGSAATVLLQAGELRLSGVDDWSVVSVGGASE